MLHGGKRCFGSALAFSVTDALKGFTIPRSFMPSSFNRCCLPMAGWSPLAFLRTSSVRRGLRGETSVPLQYNNRHHNNHP